jgi:hypothetical protein
MRRIITLGAVMLLALGVLAGPATADEAPPGPDFGTPHTHFLLIGADVTWHPEGTPGPPYTVNSYKKCVPLAGGRALMHNRHHENLHFGQANVALVGAGHIIVPFGCP